MGGGGGGEEDGQGAASSHTQPRAELRSAAQERHPPTVNLKALQVKTFFLNCTH